MSETNERENLGKKKLLITIFIPFFIGTLVGSIIVPILQFYLRNYLPNIYPASVKIDVSYYPILKDGKTAIRVYINNNGLRTLDRLLVDYKLCDVNNTNRAILHKTLLIPNDNDYFDIETNLDFNCSIMSPETTFEFYKDIHGKEYCKFTLEKKEVCGYCKLDIKLYAKNFHINYTAYIPYKNATLSISGEPSRSSCIPYEKAKNKTELILISNKTFSAFMIDMTTGCIRGDIDSEWCCEQGYIC